jgi:ATP-dependent DNA ligase
VTPPFGCPWTYGGSRGWPTPGWTVAGEHERASHRFSEDGRTQEISWSGNRMRTGSPSATGPLTASTVRPEQVVEIAIDGVQRSTRYPGGVALRFARVVRYRDDKTADEIDTIDAVRAFL